MSFLLFWIPLELKAKGVAINLNYFYNNRNLSLLFDGLKQIPDITQE
jgi:hypothetical protein